MTSRNPDAELHLMQRMWRDLEALPVAGRRRLLVYLFARVDEIPEQGNGVDRGPQQLDIEDTLRANVLHLSA